MDVYSINGCILYKFVHASLQLFINICSKGFPMIYSKVFPIKVFPGNTFIGNTLLYSQVFISTRKYPKIAAETRARTRRCL